MSERLSKKSIVECLFEDLPSDSDSFTSYDDSDANETYLPNKEIEVIKDNNLPDDNIDQNDDDLVEILNLDEGNVLPSPIKTRHSLRYNVRSSATLTHPRTDHNRNIRRPLFPRINQESNYQLVKVPKLENNIIENVSPENTLEPNINENEVSNNFEFTPPIWSKNNVISEEPLPDFTWADGQTSLITEDDHTLFSTFQLLFSNEILDLLVYQTNLYAHQLKIKTGKNYTPTDKQEIMTFLGIKHLPSYRDYWSTSLDLHDEDLSSLMTVNRFGWLISYLHLNDNSVIPKRGEKGSTFFKKKFQKFSKILLSTQNNCS